MKYKFNHRQLIIPDWLFNESIEEVINTPDVVVNDIAYDIKTTENVTEEQVEKQKEFYEKTIEPITIIDWWITYSLCKNMITPKWNRIDFYNDQLSLQRDNSYRIYFKNEEDRNNYLQELRDVDWITETWNHIFWANAIDSHKDWEWEKYIHYWIMFPADKFKYAKESLTVTIEQEPKTDVVTDINVASKSLYELFKWNSISKEALTHGIPGIKEAKEWIIYAHIFWWSYDLWVNSYSEEDETFFWFASFWWIDDMCAEWGYVSLQEIMDTNKWNSIVKVERDFYWTECTLDSLSNKDQFEPAEELSSPIVDFAEKIIEEPDWLIEDPIISEKFIDIDTWEIVKEILHDVPVKDFFDKEIYHKYPVQERVSDIDQRKLANWYRNSYWEKDLINKYSWNWKLHDIKFEEQENFHKYTEAKQEFELWQFYTPDWVIEKIYKLLDIWKENRVMDMTCWVWRFANFMPYEDNFVWFDIDREWIKRARLLYNKALFYDRALTSFDRYYSDRMSYCLWNPPFNLSFTWFYSNELAIQTDEEDGWAWRILSQNLYLTNSYSYLKDYWISIFIAPTTFLEWLRYTKAKKYVKEKFYYLAKIDLPLDTFKEYQIEFATSVFIMVKKKYPWEDTEISFINTTFEWFVESRQFKFLKEKERELRMSYAKSKYEDIIFQRKYNDEKFIEIDKCKKKAFEYRRIWKEDKSQKILEKLPYIKNLSDYKPLYKERKHRKYDWYFLKFCKSEHEIILRRSKSIVTEVLNKERIDIDNSWSSKRIPNTFNINDLITDNSYYEEFKSWVKYLDSSNFKIVYSDRVEKINIKYDLDVISFIEKKRNKYKIDSTPNDKLKECFPVEYETNYDMLSEMEFGWRALLPHQLEDLAWMLMKDYALVAHDTWLWKTLLWLAYTKVRWWRTLVVAPSMNLIDPWGEELNKCWYDYFVCKTKKDITKYNWQDYLIVSLESLPNYYETLSRIQFRNLILDESDNIKSKKSIRFKSLKSLMKKFKYKIVMSWTPTRNNVVEIYNQIEILCQNSINMLSFNKNVIRYNRSYKDYREETNEKYMKPYPAWGWFKLFQESFSPKKITCFWATETNQDIYNKDSLDRLLSTIRFTRIYDIEKPRINAILWMENQEKYKEYKQIMVPMNKKEWEVYEYILWEFAIEVEEYYQKIHDWLTASMLVIMRQIMALLQWTSHPWIFRRKLRDENGNLILDENWLPIHEDIFKPDDEHTSSKLKKAIEIITKAFEEWRKVMCASPWRETADEMERQFIASWFKTFRIESEMSKIKRAKVVTEFRQYSWPAIITGTMWCLKSWLNLPEVSVVIAESYPWNFAQLHQYAARAIRLNSPEKTMIYCLCAEWSFDINVFALMMKKETSNIYVKTWEDVDISELVWNFGSDTDIFKSALEMVKDKVWWQTRGTIKWTDKNIIT